MAPVQGRFAWIAVAGVLSIAACGSTVQTRSTLESDGGASLSGGGLDGTSSGGSGISSGRTSGGLGSSLTSGTSGSFADPSSSGSSTTGAMSATSGAAGGTRANVAPSGPVKIGYLYSSDLEAVGKSFGATGLVAGDTSAQYKAIAADINKRGGVLGRQLLLIGHDISTANQVNNPSQEEEKACADFAQDKHVFAVLTGGVFLSPCLAKYGIPTISAGGFDDPSTINSQLIYDGGGMLTTILAKAYVNRLVMQRYFTGWNTLTGQAGAAPVKVGLIYQDLPLYRHYYADVKRQLKAHGIVVDPSNEFIYSPTADGVATQSQAAVIKFSGDGVTHVFGAALLFFKAAANQRYYPRYGFDSVAPPALLESNVEPKQLHGALGVGWRPTWDVNQASDPGPVSALATRCTEIMRAIGEDVSTRTVVYLSHVACEQLWSLERAFDKGGSLSLTALRAGFDALGSPTPVVSFGERWAPDRHASNTTVADLAYLDACSCFAYTKARTSF